MTYYELMVADHRYHGVTNLVYSCADKLKVGQLVRVTLKNKPAVGVIIRESDKPEFKVTPISEVLNTKPLPHELIMLREWLIEYYPGSSGAIANLFLPKSLLLKRQPGTDIERPTKPLAMPKLTTEQNNVVKSILGQSNHKSILLHGETASGKTRIYIEIAKKVLSNNKSVVILTPEISLTPQLVARFKESLADYSVYNLHSSLTQSQRKRVWLNILSSEEPVVVVGARSALFAPVKNLGLIVVDEAHEASYKQDRDPYYYALRVASKLAEIHKSLVIFGSATPGIADYYLAMKKHAPILRLEQNPLQKTGTPEPVDIQIVSTHDRQHFTKHPYLSDALLGEIEIVLNQGEQSLIFLNRRGTARTVACHDCDWQALCPSCELPLAYHGDSHKMICHTCGYKTNAINRCPKCHSSEIIFSGIGTKAVSDALARFFPKAKISRFDADNIVSERFEKHFDDIHSGKVDIIVGTQIISKGLDLPKLSLVGVIAAETSLFFPDFTSEERTYQLLRQVIGRVGRGHRSGKAIIQAHDPKNHTIISATKNNWQKFLKEQLGQRERHMFPPYCHLLKLTCRRKTEKGAIQASEDLKNLINNMRLKVQVIGPSPSFHERKNSGYQWQLVVKAKNRKLLTDIIKKLPTNWTWDIDPLNLL